MKKALDKIEHNQGKAWAFFVIPACVFAVTLGAVIVEDYRAANFAKIESLEYIIEKNQDSEINEVSKK